MDLLMLNTLFTKALVIKYEHGIITKQKGWTLATGIFHSLTTWNVLLFMAYNLTYKALVSYLVTINKTISYNL